jgi:O-methyltransferase
MADSRGDFLNDQISQFIEAARGVLSLEQPFQVNPGSKYVHHRLMPAATLAPWFYDEGFVEIYNRVRNHTLVDLYRCYELWSLAQQTADIEGDILEVGVWKGGTGAVISRAVMPLQKKVYLADTFRGVVKAGEHDPSYVGGEHADTSADLVAALLNSLDLRNAEILVGVFPEDTGNRIAGKISMLHCDVDVYESAKGVVEWALPRLSVGAVIVFDDYGFSTCEGIARYCDELRSDRRFRFIHNLNGHAIFIKIF